MNLNKLQDFLESFMNASDEAQDVFTNSICGDAKIEVDASTHDEVSILIDDFRKTGLNDRAATAMETKLAALDDDEPEDEDPTNEGETEIDDDLEDPE